MVVGVVVVVVMVVSLIGSGSSDSAGNASGTDSSVQIVACKASVDSKVTSYKPILSISKTMPWKKALSSKQVFVVEHQSQIEQLI